MSSQPEPKSTILVVEDDVHIHDLILEFLSMESYRAKSAYTAREALEQLTDEVALIILDLMLPDLSGEDLATLIRQKTWCPILVLSAKLGVEDKVTVLKLGADDYLTKPFRGKELLARVEALLRRYKRESNPLAQSSSRFEYRELTLDLSARECHCSGERLDLTSTEFLLLQNLMEQVGQVLSRDQLYQSVWGAQYLSDDNAVNVHISHLRRKIRNCSGEDYIQTIWGIGYKLPKEG